MKAQKKDQLGNELGYFRKDFFPHESFIIQKSNWFGNAEEHVLQRIIYPLLLMAGGRPLGL